MRVGIGWEHGDAYNCRYVIGRYTLTRISGLSVRALDDTGTACPVVRE